MPQPPARLVALAAAVGNLLQGWDNAAIAGALLYLKPEFSLDRNPGVEGVLAASSLIGAWFSTLVSGPGADWMGRRSILCISALLYTLSSCVMFWSPSVPVLIVARLVVGAAVGISVTIVPIYIAEIAPAEIRGQLSTFPQFMGSGGMFFSYVLCFSLSLTRLPDWRLMLALLLLPSAVFLLLGVFYLPESPRWLVSKGKMLKAREVLQRLRNRVDVSAELALLVEGLGVGAESTLQEWTLEPPDESSRKSSLLSFENGNMNMSWVAKPVTEDSFRTLSRHTTSELHSAHGSLVDPVVTIFGSLQHAHDSFLLDSRDSNERQEEPDIDVEKGESNNETDPSLIGEFDEDQLKSPLLSGKSLEYQQAGDNDDDGDTGSFPKTISSRPSSLVNVRSIFGSFHNVGSLNDSLVPTVGIGGGWQLGWQWEEHPRKNEAGFKRVFLLQENSEQQQENKSSIEMPPPGETIQAAAVVGQPAQSSLNVLEDKDVTAVGPAVVHPVETALKGPAWSDLLEGGVRRALIVAVVLQVLQQFSGINAALYYVPQILQQSGATAELTKAGLNENSCSILGSGFACFLMLPTITLAMRLMDKTGRRRMLLSTLPILLASMIMIIISNTLLSPETTVQSTISFIGVILYVCIFVMGFGPIPNIIASEIFPTRVRGVCIGICQLAMWSCNILLTNMFPLLLVQLGLAGTFACFAVCVTLAWVFTLLKVPETKGMPLEVIIEFFAMSAR